MKNKEPCIRRHRIYCTKLAAIAVAIGTLLNGVASFHVTPPNIAKISRLSPPVSKIRRRSSPDPNDGERPAPGNYTYDSLYEFLTQRSGEESGESDRQRKRDRIKQWVNRDNKRSGPTNMVQPLRVEDGSVMEEDDQASRQKPRFEKLFSGMPTLDEILSRDNDSSGAEGTNTPQSNRGKKDDTWFDAEKQQIEQEYIQILEDVKRQIAEQRASDPDGVPENSEAIAESVIGQELKRMITSVKTERAKERLQDLEIQRMADLRNRDLSTADDALATKLLQEAADDWKRKDAIQADIDEFDRYAAEAIQRSLMEGGNEVMPQPGSNLDAWALERLEDMLDSSSEVSISDILEDNIEDLRERLERESEKGTIQPQTMKEWQMYRAIATRLKKERVEQIASNPMLNQDKIDEELIAKQLNAWREYVGKESEIRERSGLAAGPQMPFDWQKPSDNQVERDGIDSQTKQTKSRREIRREVNIQAIQALEDLIQKSDRGRAENLKKQLEILKAELEPLDYNDIEEEIEEPLSVGPVDLKDVFGPREIEEQSIDQSPFTEYEKYSIDRMMSGGPEDLSLMDDSTIQDDFQPTQKPPNTPFFSEPYEDDTNKPKPPKTPFFYDEVDSNEYGSEVQDDSKLGSIEEQKLRAMYRRAGARTKEEQDAIREQWEAFQNFEKAKRDESGLSENRDKASLLENADLKYNVEDVLKGDGDFDAEKILASIGPRPTRNKSDSKVDSKDVADAMYRSVSAVGGGRAKDDPSIREKEKADFEDYMQKEEELRNSLDAVDKNAEQMSTSAEGGFDNARYAEDALASMGPRPVFKRTRKKVLDEKEYSDRGGILSSNEDEDDDDEDEDEQTSKLDLIPDWLKKERKTMKKSGSYSESTGYFSGNDMDDVFDDDKYEHNLRQLAEYERRRSGKQQQMGIDISDVLGRNRGSDDYADYTYDSDYFRDQQGSWGSVSFEARKANLLEYVELDAIDLNNLIDHRDSIYSTGASQYLPRINKPFSEFGAIFRLEGVIMDLTGLQQQVWVQIANEFDFKEPLFDDIRRAAVVRPDVAVREIFYWTNDIMLVRKVTDSYRKAFRNAFEQWAQEKGLKAETSTSPANDQSDMGTMALGADLFEEEKTGTIPAGIAVSSTPMNEQTRLQKLKEAWTSTANEFGFQVPSNEQIAQCSFLVPDIAIRDVFMWASNQQEIDQVVSVFTQRLSGIKPTKEAAKSSSVNESMDEGTVLELQFLAWGKVAQEGSFEAPTPEEVLAAAVLNDPAAVIVNGFGWTDNGSRVQELASRYRELFTELVNQRLHNRSSEMPAIPQIEEKPSQNVASVPVGPTEEEILQSQMEAWAEVAKIHKLDAPPPDQVQLTMKMGANDAVRRLLGWTYNFNNEQINTIASTYENALRKSSERYLRSYDMKAESAKVPSKAQPSKPNDVSADDLYQGAFDAWTKVAKHFSYSLPDQEEVLFAMTVGPEEAIVSGFQWVERGEQVNKIVAQYLAEIKLKRAEWHRKGLSTATASESGDPTEESVPLVKIMPGVEGWIKSLYEVEMGCGVTSHLEDDQVSVLLEYAGLAELLPKDKRVSCNRGYDRDSQQMLGVALRIERRPDHCVLFDSSPYANLAAQEIEMRCVSLVGPYPRYELLSADTSAFSFSELTAMNIRRLFGERVYDQPMLDARQNLEKTTKTKTRFWDPED